MLEQFWMVAGAHFLALLSPGPDFFLIARGALAQGWRRASGICLGVALANGIFIVLALAGFSALRPGHPLFAALQWGGCLYLAWLGTRLLRSTGTPLTLARDAPEGRPLAASWGAGLRMGLASGLLNPKNALFYASLFSLLAGTGLGVQSAYGAWMFCAVLGWDLLVAAAIGHPAVVVRFARHLRAIERATGAVLLVLALGVAGAALHNTGYSSIQRYL